jgi:hypothetical protein
MAARFNQKGGVRFVKKTFVTGVLAAPLLMFAMSLTAQADSAPTMCKDGTTSTATGKGACSGHGGVQKAAKSAAAAPAAAPAAAEKPMAAEKPAAAPAASGTPPAGATAKCKDGSYSKSKSHSGACSKHGGVDSFLDSK